MVLLSPAHTCRWRSVRLMPFIDVCMNGEAFGKGTYAPTFLADALAAAYIGSREDVNILRELSAYACAFPRKCGPQTDDQST